MHNVDVLQENVILKNQKYVFGNLKKHSCKSIDKDMQDKNSTVKKYWQTVEMKAYMGRKRVWIGIYMIWWAQQNSKCINKTLKNDGNKSTDQCKSIFGPRNQPTTYRSNAVSTRDTFFHEQTEMRQWIIWSNQA